jgi:hypothetical protein
VDLQRTLIEFLSVVSHGEREHLGERAGA